MLGVIFDISELTGPANCGILWTASCNYCNYRVRGTPNPSQYSTIRTEDAARMMRQVIGLDDLLVICTMF
jgi:hypothetical protein